MSRFMALYLEKDPLPKDFITDIEIRLGEEFEGLCDIKKLIDELLVVVEKVNNHEVSGEQIEKEIDAIIMKHIDTEKYGKIPLISEVNNRRIALIRTYLDANRFYDMTEAYPSAEEVLQNSFATELYNRMHKKTT